MDFSQKEFSQMNYSEKEFFTCFTFFFFELQEKRDKFSSGKLSFPSAI